MREKFGKDYFLIAHIDVDQARFQPEKDEGIDFMNEIDAWSRMQFKFRRRRNANEKDMKDEVESLIYGLRTYLDK